jgi:flagellin-like hook-associated protein FlgL
MQVVAHNLAAMFTENQLKINTGKSSKSAEKLSSGYRINRAADDAAGLSISEKMRKQIRGLDRGSDNIQDGISLCQVADGALAEVTDILQRVRQLSIQAYNGTNSASDRQCIQDEVNQCLKEVEGISERTKFNELYVLKGATPSTITVTEEVIEKNTQMVTISRDKPSWMYVDSKIEEHNTYAAVTQDNTDPAQIMKQTLKDANGDPVTDADGNYVTVYYGPDLGTIEEKGVSYTWAGSTWTSEITDNPSAKMDFSGLLNASTVEELYGNMIELLGVRIAFPCGTCGTNVQGVSFTGEVEGLSIREIKKNTSFYKSSIGSLDLSQTPVSVTDTQGNQETYNGYFELIGHLADEQAMDDTLTDDMKKAQVLNYAKLIASDLAQKTYQILDTNMGKHFDRAAMDATDPYSVYVYDYRDRTQLQNEKDADTRDIYTKSEVVAEVEGQSFVGGITHTVQNSNGISIHASANCTDKIYMDLPEVSRKSLGLEDYTVSRYTTEINISYSDAYQKKLDEWAESGYVEKTKTCEGDREYQRLLGVKIMYENGERITVPEYETYTKHETWTETYREYEPKPTPGPDDVIVTTNTYYDPTSLDVLDDAIAKVCKIRSGFGAYQNRLEHAKAINDNTAENTQAGESRIRDTDMAEEMVNYSANNILVQAGNSFMTQAMQNPQGVLQLLQ